MAQRQTARNKGRRQEGITILELVVALAAVTILVTAMLFTITRAIFTNRLAQLEFVAAQSAQRTIELLRTDSLDWNQAILSGCVGSPLPPPGANGSLCDGSHEFTPPGSLPTSAGCCTYIVSDAAFPGQNTDIRRVDLTIEFNFQGKVETYNITTYIARYGLNLR